MGDMTDLPLQQLSLLNSTSWPLLLTLAGYTAGLYFYRRGGQHATLHPIILAAPLIYLLISLLKIDLPSYTTGNGVLFALLGPATVALAVPLSRQLHHLRYLYKPLLALLLIGGFTAALCALLLAWGLALDNDVLLSLATKSVTSPIAIDVSREIGGIVAIAVIAVLITGLIGIVLANYIFHHSGVTDHRWQGLILGICAHAIGTARAFEISPKCGAFATLGMGMTGIWSSLFLPWLVAFFVN